MWVRLFSSTLSKTLIGFWEVFSRDKQNQNLGAAAQREKNDEAVKQERDEWAEIDAGPSDPESAYDGLSGWAKRRSGHGDN